jgi:anti-anti-sigma factor
MSADAGGPQVGLSVTVQPGQAGMRLIVTGEVELSTADMLVRAVGEALDMHPPAIEVDLAGVTFMDSTGIGALLQARKRATVGGTALTVVNPQPSVRRILEITGLLGLFTNKD